ncbi:MAG: phospholipid carrier-dependent glycosyltransferase, partial [Candidatus Andersenbacteria bacterium]|nr:phospholipid carrier-dependent glycosyltransferase [Candidatus Andersenbacteria bacterium]
GLHFTALDYPRQVVFDEVHFGKFVNAYCCTKERFFDIHPPHAKLLIAGVVALTSYNGSFSFDHIGQPYASTVPVFALRFIPALMGMLLPFVLYWLIKEINGSQLAALLTASAVVFDSAMLLQTRVIALDGVLLVAQFAALACYLAGRRRRGPIFWAYILASGALAGLAGGVKFTGLAALVLLGFLLIIDFYQKPSVEWRRLVLAGLLILGTAVVIYGAGWWLHYQLLDLSGSGDAWQKPSGNFLPDVIEMHRKMLSANYHLAAAHPYASAWWTWPLIGRPVFYWQGAGAAMYFIGNPLVWWGAFALFIAATIRGFWALWQRKTSMIPPGFWFLLVGYVVSLVPLMRVPRALFLYHYATPLLFSLAIAAISLDGWLRNNPAKRWGRAAWIILAMALVFLLFSPLTYGFEVPDTWRTLLFWFPSWR